MKPSTDIIDAFNKENFFLSNFYPLEIVYEGLKYPTAENAYQAAKVLPGMRTSEWQSHHIITPGKSKRLGRKLPLRADWEDGVKDSVMEEILKIKFSNKALRQKLLETGHAVLIEGNFWGDTYWGMCKGKGKNKLGLMLMGLRFKFQMEEMFG